MLKHFVPPFIATKLLGILSSVLRSDEYVGKYRDTLYMRLQILLTVVRWLQYYCTNINWILHRAPVVSDYI